MSQPWHLWKKFWRSENSFSHPPAVQLSTQKNPLQPHVLAPTFASYCPLILWYNQHTHPWPISPWLFLFSHSADYRKYTVGGLHFISLSISLCILSINIPCIFSPRLFLISQFSSLGMYIFRYPSCYNPWLLISVTIPYRVHRCILYEVHRCTILPVLCIYSVYFDPASSCFLNQLFWPLPFSFLASPHFLCAPISTLLTWLPAQILI